MRRRPIRLLATMKIAVVGKGNIGGTLGTRWQAAGHDVVYGTRDGSGEGPGGAPARTMSDALADADVVVLAVPGQAVADVVSAHGAALAGKVVDRCGEPHGRGGVRQPGADREGVAVGPVRARVQHAGLGELRGPGAGREPLLRRRSRGAGAGEELIRAVGLEPAFVGDASATATVDALLPLWFALVTQNGGHRKLALRVVRAA